MMIGWTTYSNQVEHDFSEQMVANPRSDHALLFLGDAVLLHVSGIGGSASGRGQRTSVKQISHAVSIQFLSCMRSRACVCVGECVCVNLCACICVGV